MTTKILKDILYELYEINFSNIDSNLNFKLSAPKSIIDSLIEDIFNEIKDIGLIVNEKNLNIKEISSFTIPCIGNIVFEINPQEFSLKLKC